MPPPATKLRRPGAKSAIRFSGPTLSIGGPPEPVGDPLSLSALPPSAGTRKLFDRLFAREKSHTRRLIDLPRTDSWRAIHCAENLLLREGLSRPATAERQIRGAVLVSAYAIEYSLGLLISQIFFPSRQAGPEGRKLRPHVDQRKRRALFGQCFLESGLLSFGAKIDTLKIMLAHLPSAARLIPKDFLSHVRRVIDLRNRFALYPVIFTPSGDRPNEQVRASLVCHDKEIILNEAFLIDMDRLFDATISDLKRILESVRRAGC